MASLEVVTMNAATVLDRTFHLDGRGPRTWRARRLLAEWLDTGRGSLSKVREAIRWLNKIANERR